MFATTAFGNVVYLVSGQHLFKTRFEKSIVQGKSKPPSYFGTQESL